MKETRARFQDQVDEYLIRHRSVLDVLSKLQEATARTNRAFSKAVTSCGCVTVTAAKQQFPTEISLAEIRAHLDNHVGGTLCERCREAVETEIGSALFYTAALCSVLNLDLDTIQKKEHSRIKSLGIFNLK
ncbi:MAG TPA: DUF1573 domain-containing protein [bacterium]|nr:DUF1573 domain-containing protein [bacterium]